MEELFGMFENTWCLSVFLACGFMFLDLLTGIIQALFNGTLNSTPLKQGLISKTGIFLLIVLAAAVDYAQSTVELGFVVPITKATCTMIILMEIVSIVENITFMNPALKDSPLAKIFDSKKEPKVK
jgi:toxin secretion/phage lysis holin